MCGITGIVVFDGDANQHRVTLEQMTHRLQHRGPDGEGFWTDSNALLGHTRLAVVDPQGGAQPMTRSGRGGTWVITYNGELYNAPELRSRLQAEGYAFTTRSDTEVVLNAFIEYGPKCLSLLDGIFAFGVYATHTRQLFLARDRLGVKPLFYAQTSEAFLFASEIKALLAHPAVSSAVSASGLAELLLMYPARTPGQAIFRDIQELRPAHFMQVSPEGVQATRYWALPLREHEHNPEQTSAEIARLLDHAVERQLAADVPVCTFLSGGLDSSAITAIAAEHLKRQGQPLRTYSVAFVENAEHFQANRFHEDSDDPYIDECVTFLGTHHTKVQVSTAEILRMYGRVVAARDLPGMGDIDAALYLLCQKIKPDVTVALSGEGADEVFGGYPWALDGDGRHTSPFPWAMLSNPEWLLRPEILAWIKPKAYLAESHEAAHSEMSQCLRADAEEDRTAESLYLLISRFLPSLLERKDRMSMAAGVAVRVPYCDHRLVEYAWSIPWAVKSDGHIGKGILRRAMSGRLPTAIQQRPKSPFPSSYDPVLTRSLRSALRARTSEPESPLLQILQPSAVQMLVQQPAGNAPFFENMLLSFLVQLDLWLRHYRVTFS